MIARTITEWWRTALGPGREPSADQIAAITAPHTGRHSVDAGAGTGKTSTLALRALYLIESECVRADQIVVVTFTNKAAAEIGSRIADTIDRAIENGANFENDGRGVRCNTIHGLASDIRREFAFDLGFDAPPTAVSDGEAHAIFSGAFKALLAGGLDVDTSSFPVAEVNLAHLERDLGKLALQLKNHSISPDTFETRALNETERFGRQEWGQLFTPGKSKKPTRTACKPKVAVTAAAIAREAERERANVRVVAELLREFDRRLRERGAATYGDLIGETTASLRARPQIVARLRARWRYVLLDESQDTSDLQLAFIETLFGKPGDRDAAGMMPVGDGRQAIYGFNGADERVMERLADVAEKPLPLTVNRRSFQEIVEIGHAVLEAAGVVDEDTPKLEAQNGLGTLECVRLQNFGVPKQPLKERVKAEAEAIAGEIRKLLSDGAIQMSDIAILVRRRTHAAVYLRALNRRGISAALDRRSGLFVADEIRDALAWMALLVDLGDKQAAVRVLQSELCGLNDATTIAVAAPQHWLERFLRDELGDTAGVQYAVSLDEDTRERLTRVREYLIALLPSASLPLPAAMERLLGTLPIAASYVRLGKRDGAEAIGAQAIVNLASFEVLAREFAIENPSARLCDFLEDVNRRILYDDDVQEAELDLDGVRILTIHQAKGLEWPYVFVACSTKNQYAFSGPSDRVVNYDLETGAFALKNDIDGRETFRWVCLGDEHDPSTGQRLEKPPRKEAAKREQARVFYVALTRAKKRVYVTTPAPMAEDGKNGDEAVFLKSIRDWALDRDASADLTFAPASGSPRRDENGSLFTKGPVSAQTIARTAVAVTEAPSTFAARVSFTSVSAFETCPRQARYRYRLHLPELRDARPRFAGLDGNETPFTSNAARLGSLAHRALEYWGRGRLENRHGASDRAGAGVAVMTVTYAEAFENARREFDDVTDSDAARARASGERAVEALAGYTLLAVEEPFEIDVGATKVEGSVDLIARDAAGRVVVIDYKTGRTDGEHYALQLALYRRVAELRYPGNSVEAAILRLTPESATMTFAAPLLANDIERAVTEVGGFASDLAKVGEWCNACSYREAPCVAPLAVGAVR